MADLKKSLIKQIATLVQFLEEWESREMSEGELQGNTLDAIEEIENHQECIESRLSQQGDMLAKHGAIIQDASTVIKRHTMHIDSNESRISNLEARLDALESKQ